MLVQNQKHCSKANQTGGKKPPKAGGGGGGKEERQSIQKEKEF